MFLLSEEFVRQLSPRNQRLCRCIDNVVLVGKSEPSQLYTWDMWLGKPDEQGKVGSHDLSPLRQLKARSSSPTLGMNSQIEGVSGKVYIDMFGTGFVNYKNGHWGDAKKIIKRCLELVPDDGPALVLMEHMEKHSFESPANWPGFRRLDEK